MIVDAPGLDYTSCISTEWIPARRRQISTEPMTSTHREDVQRRIIELEVEHRDLDNVIDMLMRDERVEDLQLRRLKKRRLQLKDHIALLKMQLVPDIPA
jgi:hypothetical protein